ncbi:MAG: hypothetical protein V1725_08155 [archaeon]
MKKNNTFKQGTIKYIIGLAVCFLIRLLPFRPANMEPIMTTTLPFSKKWGWAAGALFGMLSIVLFDLIHPTPGFPRFGIWTLVTAVLYGLVGVAAGLYLKKREGTILRYTGFAVIATLVYDFLTGPIMSSMIFNMPFSTALIGQIPFTLMHLLGNVIGAAIISPLLYRWVVDNRRLDTNALFASPAVRS